MISGVVVYSGSWQYPDDAFAEAVVIQAAQPQGNAAVTDLGEAWPPEVPESIGNTWKAAAHCFPRRPQKQKLNAADPERRMIFSRGQGLRPRSRPGIGTEAGA
jgi:hypothetical protein